MNLNFNVTGKARGKLANIIAEALDQECTYMKAPTYAYEIGAFTITREGELEFDVADVSKDEIKTAVDAAKSAGFEIAEIDGEPTKTEGEDSPETAPEIEPQADGEETPESESQGDNEEELGEDLLTISYPVEGFSLTNLNNLCQMIIAKKPLIQKALGIDSVEIDYDETEIRFPWFKANSTPDEVNAYSQFICQLCKTAQSKQRVTATAPESFENEKFSMRVWLISLGCKGEEFAFLRKRLMRDLSGNSGFRYEDKQPRNPRSGERVQKEVVSVRFTEGILDKLAELASQSNMSRNQLIESVVCEYVQTELPAETDTEDSE
jgi:hypothetical protein